MQKCFKQVIFIGLMFGKRAAVLPQGQRWQASKLTDDKMGQRKSNAFIYLCVLLSGLIHLRWSIVYSDTESSKGIFS